MTPEKFEYELEKARADRDYWEMQYRSLSTEHQRVLEAVEQLHELVDPGYGYDQYERDYLD